MANNTETHKLSKFKETETVRVQLQMGHLHHTLLPRLRDHSRRGDRRTEPEVVENSWESVCGTNQASCADELILYILKMPKLIVFFSFYCFLFVCFGWSTVNWSKSSVWFELTLKRICVCGPSCEVRLVLPAYNSYSVLCPVGKCPWQLKDISLKSCCVHHNCKHKNDLFYQGQWTLDASLTNHVKPPYATE